MMKFSIVGRLTKDVELRYTQGENPTAIGRISIAVNRKRKGSDGNYPTDFFNCTAFGKQAESLEKYVKKGQLVALYGHVQNENYTNKDGQKVYGFGFIVNDYDFCSSNSSVSPATQTATAAPATPETSADEYINIPDGIDEELPFNC